MLSGVPGMIGETALVVRAIHGTHQPGLIRARGEEWMAIPLSADDTIEVGATVVVAGVERGLLIVYPTEEL